MHRIRSITTTIIDDVDGYHIGLEDMSTHALQMAFQPKNWKDANRLASGFAKNKNWKAFYQIKNEWIDLRAVHAQTVHKSQGSDFESVFLVIPEKKALLSRELLYTALTRSKERLFVFIQKSESDLLSYARRRSDTVQRNSSLFATPQQIDRNLIPEGVSYSVISRIEYIIHNVLTKNGLKPNYENPLTIKNRERQIKPDFTLNLPDGRTIYWEHLGMLDQRKYSHKWQLKRKGYEDSGFSEQLLTTDDMGGIHEEKIQKVVDDLLSGDISQTPKNPFSNQHYKLY
jgi:hypothetical protein